MEEGISEFQMIKYVCFGDSSGSFRVRAVSITSESFVSRKALPSSWRGLRDEELSMLTGVSGCVFVHATGFIGGNKTMEGAIQMAKIALESKE